MKMTNNVIMPRPYNKADLAAFKEAYFTVLSKCPINVENLSEAEDALINFAATLFSDDEGAQQSIMQCRPDNRKQLVELILRLPTI